LDDETMEALERLLTRPDSPEGAPTRWTLQRYVAGDLGSTDARAVAGAVRGSPELEAYVAGLRAEEAVFEAAHPWEDVSAALFERADQLAPSARPDAVPDLGGLPPRRWWQALWMGTAGAVAVLGLAFLFAPPTVPDGPVAPNRSKTSELLQGFVLVEGHAERIDAGATLREGDRVQFRVSTPHGYLALLGVDGTGTVSRYQPVGGEMSVSFGPGNALPLPDSLALDAAPGPEVFLAFLSDEPLLVEDLERAVHDVVQDAGSRAALQEDWAARGLAPQVSLFHIEKAE
jgi:hypothetical protein